MTALKKDLKFARDSSESVFFMALLHLPSERAGLSETIVFEAGLNVEVIHLFGRLNR